MHNGNPIVNENGNQNDDRNANAFADLSHDASIDAGMNQDDDVECVICTEPIFRGRRQPDYDEAKEPAVLPCGHIFHFGCIDNWIHFIWFINSLFNTNENGNDIHE